MPPTQADDQSETTVTVTPPSDDLAVTITESSQPPSQNITASGLEAKIDKLVDVMTGAMRKSWVRNFLLIKKKLGVDNKSNFVLKEAILRNSDFILPQSLFSFKIHLFKVFEFVNLAKISS
jgi:hypothetical protein